jgi:hypothetical protein
MVPGHLGIELRRRAHGVDHQQNIVFAHPLIVE